MGIEPTAAFGANATPLADQQSSAEQVGLNLHAIVAPLVQRRADMHKGGSLRELRQLDRHRRAGAMSLRLGKISREV
jgi:hypothetical protein